MSLAIFTNLASSLLASGIVPGDTSLTVTASEGALFPAPGAGQFAEIAVEDVSGNTEFMKCTGRTGDTLTVVRAQEGSTALTFASGSRVELRATKAVLEQFLQKTGGDTLSGTTTLSGTLNLSGSGSITNGEFTGKVRGNPGETDNEFDVPPGGGPATVGGSPVLTTANFVNNLPAGVGVFRSGMVAFWTGTLISIPTGFVLCDGTGGTPDLRDKFVLCGGGVLPTSGGSVTTSSDGSHSHTGVTGSHVLTIAEMPSHTHPGMSVDISGHDNASGGPPYMVETAPTEPLGNHALPNATIDAAGGGGGHTHTISSDGGHTHTHTPPYVAMFAIMKT